jgi:hypothetical protein
MKMEGGHLIRQGAAGPSLPRGQQEPGGGPELGQYGVVAGGAAGRVRQLEVERPHASVRIPWRCAAETGEASTPAGVLARTTTANAIPSAP